MAVAQNEGHGPIRGTKLTSVAGTLGDKLTSHGTPTPSAETAGGRKEHQHTGSQSRAPCSELHVTKDRQLPLPELSLFSSKVNQIFSSAVSCK